MQNAIDYNADATQLAQELAEARRTIAELKLKEATASAELQYKQGVIDLIASSSLPANTAKVLAALTTRFAKQVTHKALTSTGKHYIVDGFSSIKQVAESTGLSDDTTSGCIGQLVDAGVVVKSTSTVAMDWNGNVVDAKSYKGRVKHVTVTAFGVAVDLPVEIVVGSTKHQKAAKKVSAKTRAEAAKNRKRIKAIESMTCPHCGETGCLSVHCTACGSSVKPDDFNADQFQPVEIDPEAAAETGTIDPTGFVHGAASDGKTLAHDVFAEVREIMAAARPVGRGARVSAAPSAPAGQLHVIVDDDGSDPSASLDSYSDVDVMTEVA